MEIQNREQRLAFFDQHVAIYLDELMEFAWYRMPFYDRDTARDIVQTSMELAWKNLQLLHNVNSAKGWIFKIVQNQVSGYYKEKSSDERHTVAKRKEEGYEYPEAYELVADEETPQKIMEWLFDRHVMRLVLAKVDDDTRRIIIMRFWEEMTVKDIAKLLGISENSVSKRIERAIKKCREIVAKMERTKGI